MSSFRADDRGRLLRGIAAAALAAALAACASAPHDPAQQQSSGQPQYSAPPAGGAAQPLVTEPPYEVHDPTRFSFKSGPGLSIDHKLAEHLRGPQAVAIHNYFVVYANDPQAAKWTEGKKLTDTAALLLGKIMEKQGIAVDAKAGKVMVLRVLESRIGGGTPMRGAAAALEARYGDGSVSRVSATNVGFSGYRSADGAMLFALYRLIQDQKFVAFMNN